MIDNIIDLLPAVASGPPTLDVIHHCDALTLLRALPDASVDAVITDPPYGLAGRVFEFPHKHYSAINEDWDHSAPISWMKECTRVLKPGGSVVCFGGRQSIYIFAGEGIRLGWRLVNDITWIKPDAPPNFTGRMMTECTERAIWFCPSGEQWTYNLDVAKRINHGINLRDVWTFNIERENRIHPAQKPLDLVQRIVALITRPGDLIVDCFSGSGTTATAARSLGRRYIVCDLNRAYVQQARKRLADSDPYQPTQIAPGVVQHSLFEVAS